MMLTPQAPKDSTNIPSGVSEGGGAPKMEITEEMLEAAKWPILNALIYLT